MPKLYYCNTVYDVKPPNDINPLILLKHRNDKVLVLCARDGQEKRISCLIEKESILRNMYLLYYGWWDSQKMGLFNEACQLDVNELNNWDVIIILSRNRIDRVFSPLLQQIESVCNKS